MFFLLTDQPIQIGVPEETKIKTSKVIREKIRPLEKMKGEQAQNILPCLAKKVLVIFKFRPLSVSFSFTF